MLPILKLILSSVRRRRGRILMAVFSVAVGAAALPLALMLGRAASHKVRAALKLGVEGKIVVFNGRRGSKSGYSSGEGLTEEDVELIRSVVGENWLVYPQIHGWTSVSDWEGKKVPAMVVACDSSLLSLTGISLLHGRFPMLAEEKGAERVAVLGKSIAKWLYKNPELAVGKEVTIVGFTYRVIGVAGVAGSFVNEDSRNERVYVPFLTGRAYVFRVSQNGVADLSRIFVVPKKATDEQRIGEKVMDVERVIRVRRGIPEGEENDFTVLDEREVVRSAQRAVRPVGLLGVLFALIALFIGGLGVANMMFSLVAERRYEIGVLKAIGATERALAAQYLLEALGICLFGGFLGAGGSILLAELLAKILGWAYVFSVPAMVAGVLAAGLVGLFSGYYPARSAAKLPPNEILLLGR